MRESEFPAVWDYDSGPNVHTITVPVRVFGPGGLPFTLPALLDTGSAFSVFDKAVAELIGIQRIEAGERRIVQAADEVDAGTDAFLHQVRMEFLGLPLLVPVAFVPAWPEGIDNL